MFSWKFQTKYLKLHCHLHRRADDQTERAEVDSSWTKQYKLDKQTTKLAKPDQTKPKQIDQSKPLKSSFTFMAEPMVIDQTKMKRGLMSNQTMQIGKANQIGQDKPNQT